MKRKILAIVAMLCMVLSMVGCSKEAASYAAKLKEVATWEGQEETGDFAMKFIVADQEFGVKVDYTAYTNALDCQSEITMNVKEVSASGATLDTTKGDFKISPIKIYSSKTTAYISTAPIKDIVKIAGTDVSTVEALKKEYVALDTKDYFKQMGFEEKDLESSALNEQAWDMLEKFDVNLPVKQDKDTYTVELNAEQMLAAVFDLVNKSMEINKDMLTAQYKQLGMTDEQIKESFEAVKTVYSDEVKAEAVKAMQGSTAKLTSTFDKEAYTTKMDVNVTAAVEEEKIAFTMTMNDTVKKVAKKAVEMPKDATVYTMDDLMKLTQNIGSTKSVEAKPATK